MQNDKSPYVLMAGEITRKKATRGTSHLLIEGASSTSKHLDNIS